MKKPAFSIVIPCFNHAEYLSQAIQSALDQTVTCEIIVVNDGSTDNSLEVARSFDVKVVDQKNKGLARARNAGIKKAKGTYILPLDADDILLEDCVEKMQKAALENDVDVIATWFKNFGVHNNLVPVGIPSMQELKESNRLGYFSAFKKSVWKEVGGYDPKMKWGYEDYEMWINIFKRNKSLCVLQEVLILYRTKENSMLTVAQQHHEELMVIIHKKHPELWS